MTGALWPSWVDEAACRTKPLRAWFPEFDGLAPEDHVDAAWSAKVCCFTCPVKIECLERAWSMGDEYGVFGGLTPAERQHAKALGYTPREALLELEIQIIGRTEVRRTA